MNIIKLTPDNAEQLKNLFTQRKYMGVDLQTNFFVNQDVHGAVERVLYENFCNTYLSDRKNHHAIGYLNDEGQVTTALGFYEGTDDASWYWNQIRTTGDNASEIKQVLDEAIKFNEASGRLKFYSMFPLQYRKVYRRLAFSKWASERYDSFDEFYVPAKHQCKFTLPWQIMFNRTLVPTDSIVRCTYLKQEYREELFNAGAL
jgi:hypothetical protein